MEFRETRLRFKCWEYYSEKEDLYIGDQEDEIETGHWEVLDCTLNVLEFQRWTEFQLMDGKTLRSLTRVDLPNHQTKIIWLTVSEVDRIYDHITGSTIQDAANLLHTLTKKN